MRVISGKFKGRQLVSFKADHIRPTTDRVKESLFNMLMGEVEGAVVLDLFSGTGSLGIEAYSRGAKFVTFVEKHAQSRKIIADNLKNLKINENVEVIADDVFKFLTDEGSSLFDLVFIDPPFTESLGDSVMQAISISPILSKSATIAIETGTKEPIADKYQDLICVTRRQFGDKQLSIFRR